MAVMNDLLTLVDYPGFHARLEQEVGHLNKQRNLTLYFRSHLLKCALYECYSPAKVYGTTSTAEHASRRHILCLLSTIKDALC